MNFHIPFKAICWGDNVASIWAGEYIKYCLSDAVVTGDFRNHEGNYLDWLVLPWCSGIHRLSNSYIVATHHYHHRAIRYISGPLFYFDAHGMMFRFVVEDWYPSFIPNERLSRAFANLNLPDDYNVLHWSNCHLRVCMSLKGM